MHYDLRLRPAQPATPAPDAFTIHRREVPPSEGRDGLSIAFVHEGPEDGYPVVLLHGWPETKRIWWRNIGRAGRRRIPGDRPRPARLWRLRPLGGRCVRPGGVEPRHVSARARRARPRAVRGGRRRSRRRGRGGPSAPLSGLRGEARLFNTVPPFVFRRLRRCRNRCRVDPRDRRRADGRLPPPTGRDTGCTGGRTRHPGQAQAAHRRDVRAPAVGIARHVHRGRRRLHDRTVLRPRAHASELGLLPASCTAGR